MAINPLRSTKFTLPLEDTQILSSIESAILYLQPAWNLEERLADGLDMKAHHVPTRWVKRMNGKRPMTVRRSYTNSFWDG